MFSNSQTLGQIGSFVPTWKAMKRLVSTGKVRAVGVSNCSVADLEELIPYSTDVPISCNQVEVHPWLPNNELISYAKRHGILITGFSPFAGQKEDGHTLIKDETVKMIAAKNGMDVGQALQSWAVQRGTVPLGKSQTEGVYDLLSCISPLQNSEKRLTDSIPVVVKARIKSNLQVKRLSDEDMEALNGLAIPDGKGRTIDYSNDWGVHLY